MGVNKLVLAARRVKELERVRDECLKIRKDLEVEILYMDLSKP